MNDNEHLKIFLNPLAFVATMLAYPVITHTHYM